MSKAISLDEANKRLLLKHNGNIIMNSFINISSYSNFKCLICDYEWSAVAISVINSGNGCPNCKNINTGNRCRYTIEYIKGYIESFGFVLHSTEYKNKKEKLLIECPHQHILPKTFDSFKRSPSCTKCQQIKNNLSKRVPYEVLMQYFQEDNFTFIEFPNEYINRESIVKFVCDKGHINEYKLREYLKNRNCQECSIIRRRENQRGEKGSNWQGGKTILYETLKRRILPWKRDSMKNCNYKCVITGDRFDDIHHLYSFNLIFDEAVKCLNLENKNFLGDCTQEELDSLYDKVLELHYNYPLGVCVTRDIHILFHSIYGSGFNTPDQWYEFIENINNKNIII